MFWWLVYIIEIYWNDHKLLHSHYISWLQLIIYMYIIIIATCSQYIFLSSQLMIISVHVLLYHCIQHTMFITCYYHCIPLALHLIIITYYDHYMLWSWDIMTISYHHNDLLWSLHIIIITIHYIFLSVPIIIIITTLVIDI